MSTLFPTTIPDKRLSESINASASDFKVNNILGWDGAALTASDFGTIAYVVFRNDTSTTIEICEFDPSTIASTSITLDKRGLKFTGDLTTEVSGNKKTWVANETIVSFGTDVPQLLKHVVQTIGDQTAAGIKTFSSVPKTTGGNPVADNDLARKAYVDSVVAGSFPANRVVVAGTAGETVADGELIYFDTTDDEWKLCDADTAATVENVLLGVAQGAGTNGNAIANGVLLVGLDDAQTGMTPGDVMYAGNTAGEITSSPGTTTVMVGIAKSATELYFSPRFALMLTKDQQDALAGSSGTPSSSNKYVTADDVADDATSAKIVRATGTALPALSAANLINIPEKKINMEVFTSTGEWTQPAGITQVRVIVVGGGGGGGDVGTSSGLGLGGGGGAGGYAEAEVVVSGNVTVTVGAAGAASGNGGNSSFAGDTTITANGGTAGTDDAGAGGGQAGGAGGGTTNADLGITGQAGSSSVGSTAGLGYWNPSIGGSNPLGQGGHPINSTSAVGVAATGHGGGGSGGGASGTTSRIGGVGTVGVVIVYWNE